MVDLGTFNAGAAKFAQDLHIGLPLASFASGRQNFDKEIHLLIRQLAGHGLLEYRLGRSRNDEDQVIIEPQVADYWPGTPQLSEASSRPVTIRVPAAARQRDGVGVAARPCIVQNL